MFLKFHSSRKQRFRRVLFANLNSTTHYDVIIAGGGPSGLFASLLLTQYGIRHCLVERRMQPTTHPQAHFINTRSIELLRSHFPRIFAEVIQSAPASINWR